MRPISVLNTLTGKKEILKTLHPSRLTMYSCGPTVYSFIHIGNLRAALVSDMFFRYFKKVGYDVVFVRNYTDVDDKIIKKAVEEKITADQVAKKYTVEVEKDYAVAGLVEPTHKTTVTTHMPEIIQMIQKIIDNGKAYVASGEVLFAIEKFKGYGKLSHKPIDDLIAGHRVEVDPKKKNPLDFALWKPAKPDEPFWESPWSKGRPGWHIECSAMATKWLGAQIDVHHGGEDLVFPHHENEIAQSEAASGKDPYVRYWMHNAFLTLSKEKMSKSLGNIFTARDFLTEYSGEIARYMLLSVHYRAIIDFSDETIENATTSLQRIYETKAKAVEILKQKKTGSDIRAENVWGQFLANCQTVKTEIDDAFADDFNSAKALASLFTLIREFNRSLNEPMAMATSSAVLGAEALIKILEEEVGAVLGFGRLAPDYALSDLNRIRAKKHGDGAKLSSDQIQDAIQKRLDARSAKNFALADQIRKELESKGVILKDGPGGTTWEYR